ncbi:hypothetical protein GY45DRAFT_915049 [Cubamyces sp. BRFM 1775]|nr:hypothetical protein GY45DRAFT_915049 [Cubamyces sp. BRFM 1775]
MVLPCCYETRTRAVIHSGSRFVTYPSSVSDMLEQSLADIHAAAEQSKSRDQVDIETDERRQSAYPNELYICWRDPLPRDSARLAIATSTRTTRPLSASFHLHHSSLLAEYLFTHPLPSPCAYSFLPIGPADMNSRPPAKATGHTIRGQAGPTRPASTNTTRPLQPGAAAEDRSRRKDVERHQPKALEKGPSANGEE